MQYWQTLWNSKVPTNYMDILKQKEQIKPKINLFDFTQTPQMNFWQWVSQRNVTNFGDYKTNIPIQPTQQQTQPTPKSGFSLIPTANAWNNNIIQTFLDDSKTKPDLWSKRNAVIEMLKNWEDESFIEDAIVKQMQWKPTQEEPWIFGKLKEAAISSLPNPKAMWEVWLNILWWVEKNITWAVNLATSPFWVEPMRTPSETIRGVKQATPSLIERTVYNVLKWWEYQKEIWEWQINKEQWPESTTFQTVGNIWETLIWNILWDAFISWLSTVSTKDQKEFAKQELKKLLNTKWAKSILEKVDEIEKDYEVLKKYNPWLARNFKAWKDVALTFLDLIWYKTTKSAWKITKETLENIPRNISEWVIKQLPDVWKKVKEWVKWTWKFIKTWYSTAKQKTWNYYDDVLSWLSKAETSWYKANPYQAEEFNKMIKVAESSKWIDDIKNYKTQKHEEIWDELIQEIENIKKTKWEEWAIYNDIKQLDTKVNTENIINNFQKTFDKYWIWVDKNWKLFKVEWSKWGTLTSWDLARVEQLYKNILADSNNNWWFLNVSQTLKNRSDASAFSNYEKQVFTDEWLNIMRELRSNIDNVAKNEIPWLKWLDELFADKVNELWKSVQDLIYKQWDVKWDFRSNLVSIISNLDKPNRTLLLNRLEEIMPWIWKRVEAINNLTKLYNKVYDIWKINKFTKTAWAITWATALTSIPVVWPIIWWIVWYVWWSILEKIITKKTAQSIKNIVWKISKERLEELNIIKQKLQNKQKLTDLENKRVQEVKDIIEEQIIKDKIFPKETNLKLPQWVTKEWPKTIILPRKWSTKTPAPGKNRIIDPNKTKNDTYINNNINNSNNAWRLILPPWKKPAIITPQTKDKWLILESKKGLENTKFWNTNQNKKTITKPTLPPKKKVVTKPTINEKPYWYNAKNTTSATNKYNADLEYKNAEKWIWWEIINDISLEDIQKLYNKNIKKNDIVERIEAVRKIKGSTAYANAKFVENKNLSNQENWNNWKKIFDEKLNPPKENPKLNMKYIWENAEWYSVFEKNNGERVIKLRKYWTWEPIKNTITKPTLPSKEKVIKKPTVKENIVIKKPVETLPKDIDILEESKKVWPKRISPDRVDHQQLLPEESINKIKQKINKIVWDWESIKPDFTWIRRWIKWWSQKSLDDYNSYIKWLEEWKYEWLNKRNKERYVNSNKEYFEKLKIKLLLKDFLWKDFDSIPNWIQKLKELTNENMKKIYIDLVNKDISKWYKFTDEVLNYDKSFKTAVDNRAKYEKWLNTSFSADDSRIVFDDRLKIWMKRQDWKELTQPQRDEIVKWINDFKKTTWLNLENLFKDEKIVIAHLNWKNPFLMKNVVWLYRKSEGNKSISMWWVEKITTKNPITWKIEIETVNTTLSHELWHSLDAMSDRKLLENVAKDSVWSFNKEWLSTSKIKNYYWTKNEVKARLIEQYVAIKKWLINIYERPWYWNKEIFDKIIPEIEKWFKENFKEYMSDLVDKIAEKTWAKINLLPTNSKQVSKISDDLIENVWKYTD